MENSGLGNPAVWLPLLVAVAGGVAVAFQAPLNSALGTATGNSVFAACASFFVGFCALAVIVLLRGGFPDGAAIASVPWWYWLGGILGAWYVWASLWSVPRIGVVTLAAALIFGQLMAALVIDSLGMAGLSVRELGWQRILAVVLVGAGLVLSRM